MALSSSSSSSSWLLVLAMAGLLLISVDGVSAAKPPKDSTLQQTASKITDEYIPSKDDYTVKPSDCKDVPGELYPSCMLLTQKNYNGAAASYISYGAYLAVTLAEGFKDEENEEEPEKKALAACRETYKAAAGQLNKAVLDLLDNKPLTIASLNSSLAAGDKCDKDYTKSTNAKTPTMVVNRKYHDFAEAARIFLVFVENKHLLV